MRQFQGSILVFVNTSRKALAVLLILAAGLVSLRSQDLRSTPPILSSPSSLFPTPAPPTLPTPDKSDMKCGKSGGSSSGGRGYRHPIPILYYLYCMML